MLRTSGIFGKMVIFIFLLTAPVSIVAIWLVSQNLLIPEYAVLLSLTPVAPAVLIYNRLLQEMNNLSAKIERDILVPEKIRDIPLLSRSGLLPVNDLLLTMQQYQRILQASLNDAEEQQEKSMFLFDMLPDPVFVLDEKRRISHCNNAAKSFFDLQDMQGDLTSYLRHPSLIKAVDAALAGKGDGQPVEFALAGKVARQLVAYVVNLHGEGGQELQVIISLHDVTAAKKTEQMRVDFVANASHELRTPLAILIGAIETLKGPAAGDMKAQPRFLDMMHAQSQRMSQLIDDLLSLSHIEMNEHSRPSETVNLSELLQAVAEMIGSKASSLDKSLDLQLGDTPLFAVGDKDQLFQIFTNLVDNALKYGREESPVVIRLTESGRKTSISVIDQGEGIASEHLPRLTERFYRIDSDRSRKMGGTGLGLAIVKHIVSRHRGDLLIDSEVGKGSVFTINLPSICPKK